MTDIAFSVHSILAAVGTADVLPDRLGDRLLVSVTGLVDIDVRLLVIYIGGILGIVAMRFVAGYFLILLDHFHGLAVGAYYLVGWIGLKLLGGGLDEALHPRHFVPAPGGWRESLAPLGLSGPPRDESLGLLVGDGADRRGQHALQAGEGPTPPLAS